jgi:hypothetical protein
LLEQWREQIALRLDRGENLADVEADLIDSAGAVSEDEQAALRLFAWSYQASGRLGDGVSMARTRARGGRERLDSE